MHQQFPLAQFSIKKFSIAMLLFLSLLLTSEISFSQCSVLANAVQGISYTMVQGGGTNAGGVAYNPTFDIYYAGIAGNPTFPLETFNSSGTSLYQTNVGFDCRGVWWNPNTNEVEMNGYYTYGLWTSDLDINGYALNTGTYLFTGQNQPDAQSCGDYDYDADEIIYYYNGSIYRYDRSTNLLLGSYALTGIPVPISDLNWTTVIYTGCCGNEIGVLDYVNKAVLLFNKATGAYSGTSQLPGTAVTNYGFNFSYANGLVWLQNTYTHEWISYSILTGTGGASSINLGNDTTICIGSSMVLNAGNSSMQVLWSTGSTDSTITVDSAGTYWVTVTNGLCAASDTIIISDSLCAPLIAFNSSDTSICEKFCINFSDSSQNNPTAWAWSFPGGNPSTSTDQNPMNICYNIAGSYDVTLITTTAMGNDTLILPGYITVYPTPPIPAISQIGYQLSTSGGTAYQWQFNSYNIPGATNFFYDVTQTGLYTVIVYDAHGCKNSVSQYVQIVGVGEVEDGMSISVFPNPNQGMFMIQLANAPIGEEIFIDIENSVGQTIYSSAFKVSSVLWNTNIGLGNIAGGVYFLEVKTNTLYSESKIIVTGN